MITTHPVTTEPAAIPWLCWRAAPGNAAKDAFDDRETLPSCGTFTVERSEPPTDAVRCLANAVGGTRGAELAVTRLTVEGDPYTTYYRAIPGQDDVEVFTDNTKDSYGRRNGTAPYVARSGHSPWR